MLSSTETELSFKFATIRSGLPSPLTSAAVTELGKFPVAKVLWPAKLGVAAAGNLIQYYDADRSLSPNKELLFVHIGRDSHVEEADHHLIPTLFAQCHFRRRIRIPGIRGGFQEFTANSWNSRRPPRFHGESQEFGADLRNPGPGPRHVPVARRVGRDQSRGARWPFRAARGCRAVVTNCAG